MVSQLRDAGLALHYILQKLAFIVVATVGVALLIWTAAAAAGLAPWLELDLSLGGQPIENAGLWVQCTLAGLALILVSFLPNAVHVMALERSHRSFHIGMRDIARAYTMSHRADREGVFKLQSEFDSVRERLAYLRDHPDLAELEPSVLEVAAQMSHVSRDLARTYSDRNVQRAQDFLVARQQEVEDFNIRIEKAKAAAVEIRRWHERLELDEAIAQAQLARLVDELEDILPEILPETTVTLDAPAPEFTEAPRQERVVPLPRAAE
ncbi:DNA repair protein [Alloyangia pacifica]|uniref:DNA repair protein n=1 Tax=Alloyangia pacifica TaxID=311180 RepID=A0A2U8HI01_9RHOB|nr:MULTISPECIES: DNA repair protein [Roseobacteraceae]AWI85557.1 DNA repair protein [Alloyangia pacifica]NDV53829.1 DNA repair protein [Salipiger sp. PrR003]NDW35650.1 DNA repair protein [Salipiger sp. PrR007]